MSTNALWVALLALLSGLTGNRCPPEAGAVL